MIKVNLLPVKRRKKPKPIPSFIMAAIAVTAVVIVIMAYLVFFFSSRLSDRKAQYASNERKIAELKEQIKAVEDFEKRNKIFKERNQIIEQLSKNKSVPVKILDEISALLPSGIWINRLTVSGVSNINIEGFGFTNTDIVAYVNNIKGSQMFAEVYLQESKSVEVLKFPVYSFKLTFKVKA